MRKEQLKTPCFVVREEGTQEKSGDTERSPHGDGMQDPAGAEGVLHVPGIPADRAVPGRNHSERAG